MHFALQHASMQHASPYLICNAMPSCCQVYLPCSIAANYYLACTSLSRAGFFLWRYDWKPFQENNVFENLENLEYESEL